MTVLRDIHSRQFNFALSLWERVPEGRVRVRQEIGRAELECNVQPGRGPGLTASSAASFPRDRPLSSELQFECFERCVYFEDEVECLSPRLRRLTVMATLIPENLETVAPTEADALLAASRAAS